VAKSLLINNRINRARKTIKKALYYAPNNADYLVVLGDTYCATAEKDKRLGEDPDCYNESYSKAKNAYERAITIKNDDEFKTKIEKKIKKISEKMK
jgi:tetratricopeptide (TPR) repeat protein